MRGNYPSVQIKPLVAIPGVRLAEAISIPNQMVRFNRLPESRMRRMNVYKSVTIAALAVIASTAGRAADRTIAIARSDCALAVSYVPPAGVDYQPGVDVHGRPVAPADLDDGRRLQLRDSIPVVITDDLRKQFGLADDSPLFDANAFIGIVELRLSDQRLTFNGVELSDREADALAAMCRDATKSP